MATIKTIGECIIKNKGDSRKVDLLKEIAENIIFHNSNELEIINGIFEAVGYKKTDTIVIDLGDWSIAQGRGSSYSVAFNDNDSVSTRNTMDFYFTYGEDKVRIVGITKTLTEGKTVKLYDINVDEEKNISLSHTSTKWSPKTDKWNDSTNWDKSIRYEESKATLYKRGEKGETFLLELTDTDFSDIQDNFELPFYEMSSALSLEELLEFVYKTKPLNCRNFSFTRGYHLPPFSGWPIDFDKVTIDEEEIKELLVTTDDYQLHITEGKQILKKRTKGNNYNMEWEEMKVVEPKSEDQEFIHNQQKAIKKRINYK